MLLAVRYGSGWAYDAEPSWSIPLTIKITQFRSKGVAISGIGPSDADTNDLHLRPVYLSRTWQSIRHQRPAMLPRSRIWSDGLSYVSPRYHDGCEQQHERC